MGLTLLVTAGNCVQGKGVTSYSAHLNHGMQKVINFHQSYDKIAAYAPTQISYHNDRILNIQVRIEFYQLGVKKAEAPRQISPSRQVETADSQIRPYLTFQRIHDD